MLVQLTACASSKKPENNAESGGFFFGHLDCDYSKDLLFSRRKQDSAAF